MVRFANRFQASFKAFFNVEALLTCKIKILVVTDHPDRGGFSNDEGLHLGQVLEILKDDPWSHVQFEVTRAHRQVPVVSAGFTPDGLPDFRFDAHDLTQYDQIWLFGIEESDATPLSPSELKALSLFMDGGGGVFATGDHEDIGFAMCAEVPRVRSMRRWHFTLFGPATGPQSPGLSRNPHDTLVDPPGALLPDQSDAVPQRIRPHFYTRTLNSGIAQRIVKYPHPVLCGPSGAIEYLPDHQHEGLCEVPSDLTRTFTFDGHEVIEYPTVNGHQEAPEVIAFATNRAATPAAEFGALAAYDGHRVGIGRVLVDASWHHWFNTNFLGFRAATDPQSPAFDPQVVPQWEAIKAYFYNVGLWLARKSTQNLLRDGSLLLASRSHDVLITYRRPSEITDPVSYFWQLGTAARNALSRVVSQCQIVLWLVDLLEWTDLPLDPWRQRQPQPAARTGIDDEQLEVVALGGAIHALLDAFEGRAREGAHALLVQQGESAEQVIRRGSASAVDLLIGQTQERMAALQPFAERVASRMAELT